MSINWAGVGLLAGLYGADQGVKIGRDYVNYDLQKKLQANAADLNYKYSIKSAQNMPNATRTGLESAGYNPMLAVQNSTSGANSSWTSSGSLSSQAGDSLSNAFSSVQDIQRLKNETDVSKSTEDMNYANADKAKAEANESVLRSEFIPNSMKAKIARDTAEAKNLENQIHIAEEKLKLQATGLTIQQEANAIAQEKNEIERKGNPFRTIRDFGDKYNWSPRQFGEELGRRFARDHF